MFLLKVKQMLLVRVAVVVSYSMWIILPRSEEVDVIVFNFIFQESSGMINH